LKQSWYTIALEPGIQKRSWIVAIVVGSILNIINQGDALFNGNAIVIWKLALTFCVPYCVATYGAVSARQAVLKNQFESDDPGV
jgi:hypothetical protein